MQQSFSGSAVFKSTSPSSLLSCVTVYLTTAHGRLHQPTQARYGHTVYSNYGLGSVARILGTLYSRVHVPVASLPKLRCENDSSTHTGPQQSTHARYGHTGTQTIVTGECGKGSRTLYSRVHVSVPCGLPGLYLAAALRSPHQTVNMR